MDIAHQTVESKTMESPVLTLEAKMMERIKGWQASQEGQASGYEYERSFAEMMHHLGQDILQASVGEVRCVNKSGHETLLILCTYENKKQQQKAAKLRC